MPQIQATKEDLLELLYNAGYGSEELCWCVDQTPEDGDCHGSPCAEIRALFGWSAEVEIAPAEAPQP